MNAEEKKGIQEAEKSIRILMVEPHKRPYEAKIINTLESLQKAVSGNIECRENDDGTVFVLNENSKILGMEGNRRIEEDVLCGSFFVAGVDGEDFCSLSDEQFAKYMERFLEPDEDITTEEIEEKIAISVLVW